MGGPDICLVGEWSGVVPGENLRATRLTIHGDADQFARTAGLPDVLDPFEVGIAGRTLERSHFDTNENQGGNLETTSPDS